MNTVYRYSIHIGGVAIDAYYPDIFPKKPVNDRKLKIYRDSSFLGIIKDFF